jgi:hypothetical protein
MVLSWLNAASWLSYEGAVLLGRSGKGAFFRASVVALWLVIDTSAVRILVGVEDGCFGIHVPLILNTLRKLVAQTAEVGQGRLRLRGVNEQPQLILCFR